MAILKVINKDKNNLELKSFNCNISKLCSVPKGYYEFLYHTGNASLPIDNDTIYFQNEITFEYELFINNSAAIYQSNSNTPIIKYLKTNYKGICTIINCA